MPQRQYLSCICSSWVPATASPLTLYHATWHRIQTADARARLLASALRAAHVSATRALQRAAGPGATLSAVAPSTGWSSPTFGSATADAGLASTPAWPSTPSPSRGVAGATSASPTAGRPAPFGRLAFASPDVSGCGIVTRGGRDFLVATSQGWVHPRRARTRRHSVTEVFGSTVRNSPGRDARQRRQATMQALGLAQTSEGSTHLWGIRATARWRRHRIVVDMGSCRCCTRRIDRIAIGPNVGPCRPRTGDASICKSVVPVATGSYHAAPWVWRCGKRLGCVARRGACRFAAH